MLPVRKKETIIYEIMHMEKVVAKISSNGKAIIYDEVFMPYDLFLEEDDENDIDILLNQIERISKKQERIDDILLQKFNENEISYKNFKNIISEVVNVFYINLKSVINKINIFDEEEYRKVKKENINNKISQEKIEMFQKYITFVKESVENNEEILLKLDKVLLELSKFNSLEDGELENMNAVKEVDELINKIKFYK